MRFGLLAALLAAAAAGFVSLAVQAPRFPYALDYGEGMLLDAAWRLAAGENIYPRSPVTPPYLVLSYPPLFMAALAPMTEWFGPAYWYGRVFTALCTAATAIALGFVAAQFSRRRAGVVTGLTFVAIPFVARWAPLVRVDTPALACAWAALAAVLCTRRPSIGMPLSIVLMLAAGFTRQTVWLPACSAVAAHLVTEHRLRVLVPYALSLAALAAVVGSALDYATGGFWFAVLTSNRSPLEWRQWTLLTGEVVREMPLLILVALVTIAVGLRHRQRWAPLLAGYALGTVPTIVGAAKTGATMNYFLEVAAVCALTAGLAWGAVERGVTPRTARWRGALTIVLAAQAAWWIWINHPFRLGVPRYLDATFAGIRAERGPVLADAAVGMLPIAGHHVLIEPFKMSALARAGLWNERPFLDDLRATRFGLIVVMLSPDGPAGDQWTPAMRADIENHYHRCGDIPIDTRVLALYRPSCATAGQ